MGVEADPRHTKKTDGGLDGDGDGDGDGGLDGDVSDLSDSFKRRVRIKRLYSRGSCL